MQILEARAMLTNEIPNRDRERLKSYPNEIVNQPSEQNMYFPSGSQSEPPLRSSVIEEPQVGEHSNPESVKTSAVESVPVDVKTESVPVEPSTVEAAPISYQTESLPLKPSAVESSPNNVQAEPVPLKPSVETDKHAVTSTEIPIIDKSIIDEKPMNESQKQQLQSCSSSKVMDDEYDDDGDDWLKEESSEIVGAGQYGNDEDVSFSDLEEEDGDDPAHYKKVTSGSDSSTKDSREWVQI